MKKTTTIIGALVLLISLGILTSAKSSTNPNAASMEYVTLRWDGRDNTHVIRPGGNVEFLGSKFQAVKKPNRTDERSFYMNLAMNALARDGYELVAMAEAAP